MVTPKNRCVRTSGLRADVLQAPAIPPGVQRGVGFRLDASGSFIRASKGLFARA